MARHVLWPVLALLLAACSSDRDVTPSPLPPGYRPVPASLEPGRAAASTANAPPLDEKLAVVEGEVITRRRLVREAAGLAPGEDPAQLERAVRRRLKERARLLIFVKESQRAGITISPKRLDEVVNDELERRVKEASERIGQRVTIEQYLGQENMTRAEFRQRVKEELQYKAYIVRLLRGVGGPTRAMVDLVASPAEIRRIYWEHPGAFDEKRGVRFAAFQLPVKRYLVGDKGFLDAEEEANRDAEALAAAFRRGEDANALIRRFRLEEGQYRIPRETEFAEEGGAVAALGEEANTWLFDPARRVRDATVLADPEGALILGILDQKAGKRLSYEDAYGKISELIEIARTRRVEEQRLIEILSTRDVIEPPSLADELLDDARENLRLLSEDPVFAAVRFR